MMNLFKSSGAGFQVGPYDYYHRGTNHPIEVGAFFYTTTPFPDHVAP